MINIKQKKELIVSKLRKYLTHHGVSQKKFAQLIDMTQNNLGLILCGKRFPSISTAYKIEICTGGLVTIYDWISPELRAFKPDYGKDL